MDFNYRKVLIIDDTFVDRYIAERNIKKYAFAEHVIQMDSALTALDYLIELSRIPDELPELIFLDIRMPLMDGFGFLEAFEKLPSTIHDHCKIIMLSTSLDPVDHVRVNEHRFISRFLNKPLDQSRLQQIA